MPTFLGHSAIAVAASLSSGSIRRSWKLLVLSIFCSILPDADVIGYQWLYIPYNSFFGHRGFFHSPFFAALLSMIIVLLFYRKEASFSKQSRLFLYFFLLTSSHGVMDAMTNGGHGIALLSPFSNYRYFLPWTPIQVSPLGIKAFLSQRGFAVLKNEFFWIWMPSCFIVISVLIIRKLRRPRSV